MKKYLIQFKPFLVFIGTFFSAYIVLTLLYKFYLNNFAANDVDGLTAIVSHNVEQLMRFLNCDISIQKNLFHPYFEVWYNKKYTIRIVEGCNAISVIILFVSFIIAFSGKLKTTVLFIITGSVLIYLLNVIRIAVLTVLLFYFPENVHILHGVLFPLIIYGLVFTLWVFWVNKFSKYAK
ncbi:exosortase family protein XrtF [Flavobacterium saccharophilum]|uniref:Exosortase family protein XrtF n=1 Tax=Flavobacterium saccharophilum TaxID=29534 RepID=A0A1M7B247_9FLAO|nr:exosortase family protein XrtF [Flavobacterium saccharophilum]SHL48966.1 exosortase family protein XrtF [Flavobacterium saccharophilum]